MDYEEGLLYHVCIILVLIELDSLILNIPLFVSYELGLSFIILVKGQACTWDLGRILLKGTVMQII